MNDSLQRFIFEHAAIRGEVAHLDATWQAILERQDYPPLVRSLLGEAMVAAILLCATLKANGRMTIQLQGQGPLRLLVVECSNAQELRGLAHWQDLPEHGSLQELVGDGRLIITLEPGDDQARYQSIVELRGDTLAEALGNYLQQSEQLDTHLWLAADGKSAAGMLLQKLPSQQTQTDTDMWNRVIHLATTVQPQELLELTQLSLLHRLFHQEQVRVFEPTPVCFRCPCSKNRVVNMLRSLGYAEVQSILVEQKQVSVACEFCNQKYVFDSVDIEQMFASSLSHPAPPTRQ